MAIMSFNDISRKYTEVVQSYLNKGYIISLANHYTSSCEKIGLVNPKNPERVIVVWFMRGHTDNTDCLYIKVRAYSVNKDNRYRTLWYDEGESVDELVYFSIVDNKCYTASIDELKEIRKLRVARSKNKVSENNISKSLDIKKMPSELIDYIMSKINRIHGFKRATSRCITEVVLVREKSCWSNKYKLYGQVRYAFNGKNGYLNIGR